MNHMTQEQLVDHYYGEPQGSLDVDRHLAECDQCRTQYQTLKRVLNSVEGYPVPEPAANYEARLWKKIAPEVSPRAASSYSRWWISAAAIAAMVVVAFFAGRASRTQRPAVGTSIAVAKNQSLPVLVIAVGDHLERLEAVLTELENADSHQADVDISYEQRSAEDLLDSNRLFRQTAAADGDVVTASVLEDFENVLLEITHQPAHVSPQQLEDLRRDIKDRGVLFKARVLGSRMRGEETKL
jgi:anti-sigma factor RsiW